MSVTFSVVPIWILHLFVRSVAKLLFSSLVSLISVSHILRLSNCFEIINRWVSFICLAHLAAVKRDFSEVFSDKSLRPFLLFFKIIWDKSKLG